MIVLHLKVNMKWINILIVYWPSRLGSNRSSWLRSATGSRRHATEYRYASKWMMLRNWTFILTRQEYLNCTALEHFPIFSFSNKKAGSYNSFCPHFCLKKKYIHLDLRSELRKAFDWVFKLIVCQCYLSTRSKVHSQDPMKVFTL